MNKRLMVWIGILSLTLIIGCSSNKDTATNVVEQEPAEPKEQNSTTSDLGNLAEEEKVEFEEEAEDLDQPEEVGQVESDPAIMADFQALVDKKVNAVELKSFVDGQLGKVVADDYTKMVLALEDLQDEQLLALEDRFYNGADFQEQLFELGRENFDFTEYDKVSNPELKKLLKDTQDGGYQVEAVEGVHIPIVNYERFTEYQDYVSEDIREYIAIKAIESREVSIKDAGMMIGWDEAVRRAVRQEAFITQYPNSIRNKEIARLFGGYVFVTFNGMENTPLFSYEDDMIVSEAKSAYSDALNAGTANSPYLQRLSTLLDLLDKSNNKMSDEVIDYQQETIDLWYNSNF